MTEPRTLVNHHMYLFYIKFVSIKIKKYLDNLYKKFVILINKHLTTVYQKKHQITYQRYDCRISCNVIQNASCCYYDVTTVGLVAGYSSDEGSSSANEEEDQSDDDEDITEEQLERKIDDFERKQRALLRSKLI